MYNLPKQNQEIKNLNRQITNNEIEAEKKNSQKTKDVSINLRSLTSYQAFFLTNGIKLEINNKEKIKEKQRKTWMLNNVSKQ